VNPELAFHPAAAEELLEAEEWYAERSLTAANTFAREAATGIERIREAPERWPAYIHGTRRIVLRRFPFTIIYRVGGEQIQILAVAHQKRRPGYWRDRL